jgi:thiamine-phosphate pyrophosphorylase
MLDLLTAAALRALARATELARRESATHVVPLQLLAALAEDQESRASRLLTEFGGSIESLFALVDEESSARKSCTTMPAELPPGNEKPPLAVELRAVISRAAEFARVVDRNREVGTEHLLAALVTSPGTPAQFLEATGLRRAELLEKLHRATIDESTPLPFDLGVPPPQLIVPGESTDLARVFDAASNRAREGLRVVEDYVRFVLDDPMLTRRLKECRHRLAAATRSLDLDGSALAARDTEGDVGTHIMTVDERSRENPRAVLAANFRRTEEALRSLEEFAKLSDVWLAGRFEVLRYDVYTLEKLVLTAVRARAELAEARLCVLIGGCGTLNELIWILEESLAGGAQVIQLREKRLPDRELRGWATEVRVRTSQARAVFIVNDRPDIAQISGADGVHLGQDDLKVRDAQRVLGLASIIGVSTHDVEQIERASLDGASYLGVGPVFSSRTKEFTELAGLPFVRAVAELTSRPWFAIGGIDTENLSDVLEAGARRIAVGSAVTGASQPKIQVAALRRQLDSIDE